MKIYLEMAYGYGFCGSVNTWVLRYEYDKEQTDTIEYNGKWVKFKSLCGENNLDLTRALEHIQAKQNGK